jgi:hypothetical protein
LLQSGLGGTIGEAGGGSGRPVSQLNQQEGCGQKENRNTQFTRVVRIVFTNKEVLLGAEQCAEKIMSTISRLKEMRITSPTES